MKRIFQELIVAIIILLPIVYLAYVYTGLPQTIPTHFGFNGKPDGFGSKRTAIFMVGLLALVSTGTYLLIKYLPKIDPKKTASLSSGNLQKIAIGVTVLLSALNIIIIYSIAHGSLSPNKLFIPLLGLFFIYIGNLMYNIKPNYFVGIRVPWTLENENNWRATHRMGGKLWFAGGIIITVCALILPAKAAEVIFTIGLAILTIAPIIYSFIYFKKYQ